MFIRPDLKVLSPCHLAVYFQGGLSGVKWNLNRTDYGELFNKTNGQGFTHCQPQSEDRVTVPLFISHLPLLFF